MVNVVRGLASGPLLSGSQIRRDCIMQARCRYKLVFPSLFPFSRSVVILLTLCPHPFSTPPAHTSIQISFSPPSKNDLDQAGATAIAAPLALLTSLQILDLRCLSTPFPPVQCGRADWQTALSEPFIVAGGVGLAAGGS